jgi:hypothetical protein
MKNNDGTTTSTNPDNTTGFFVGQPGHPVRAITPIRSVKGKVAVTPFVDTTVKTTQRGTGTVKVAFIENKVSLTSLEVVFDSEDLRFRAGQKVWVASSLYTQPWAKNVLEIDGKALILLPETLVELVS